MKVLITGSAGFIGNELAIQLLERGDEVIGIDNINDYYDVDLKLARLERIKDHPGFTEARFDIKEREREVAHCDYFLQQSAAQQLADWAEQQRYTIAYRGRDEDGEEYLVRYTHVGSMQLSDITHHTISSDRKARELGGRYDGWETSVERDAE